MGSKKKKSMDGIIIGFDEITDDEGKLKHTLMYTKEGAPSVILQIHNPVLKLSADASLYYGYMDVMKNILQTLGEGYAMQKQDIFIRDEYHHDVPQGTDFLSECYFRHFQGRSYMRTQTFLILTQEVKKSKFLAFDPKKHKEFLTKIDKVYSILTSSHIAFFELDKAAIDEYIHRYVAFSFKDRQFSMNNIIGTDEFLKMGNSAVKSVPLVDIDDVALPQNIAPFTTISTNGYQTPVDLLSFLTDIPYASAVVYNQAFIIPPQRREKMRLERKGKRHASLPDPSNRIAQADIEAVLDIIARDGSMIVNVNHNIIYRAPLNRMNAVNNFIQTKIYENGLGKSSSSAYNQFELFLASCPGCSFKFQDYDLFTCLSDAALCMTYKESELVTEDSPLLVYMTDRRGIPVGYDFTGKEGAVKLCDNANFFCLGPSGSGKSFTINSIVRQLLVQGTDVVLIDIGHSYTTICEHFRGTYITYSNENPISMNPFNISPVEYRENFGEKKSFLKSLIFLIFKGAEEPTNIEDSIINQVIIDYYKQYFEPFDHFSPEERRNIRKKLMIEDKISGKYDSMKSTIDAMMDMEDPDSFNLDSFNLDDLDNVEDLTDEEREKQEKIWSRAEKFRNVINDKAATDGEKGAARNQLIRIMPEIVSNKRYLVKLEERIKGMEEERRSLRVSSLSFNTFFEFSLQRIPQITKEAMISFNIYDYKRLLERFYKGGEYELTLNSNVGSTLFDANFIVFEIDKIKDDTTLFPIVVLIIMDVFLQKMRIKKGRKALIIEEAWKAISSKTMADYIKYLYKTVRKFNGIAGVVTQELNDVIDSPIIKDAIVTNADVKILLDQSKFKDRFDLTKRVLGLNDIQANQIMTINSLDNRENRSKFNEVCIIRNGYTVVYGVEEPPECYWAYTTERMEKEALNIYKAHYKEPETAIRHLEEDRRRAGISSYLEFALLVNEKNHVLSP